MTQCLKTADTASVGTGPKAEPHLVGGEGFYRALLTAITAKDLSVDDSATDRDRFPKSGSSIAAAIRRWVGAVVWRKLVRPALSASANRGRQYASLFARLACLYKSLGDEYSRQLLADIVAFRMLGHER